jgi:hypothetical protein
VNVWYLVHVTDSLTYTIAKALSQGGHEEEQATLLKVMIGAQIWFVALLTFVRWHQRYFWLSRLVSS